MSRVTRLSSRANNNSNNNNNNMGISENIALGQANSKAFGLGGGSGVGVGVSTRRSALGDISNKNRKLDNGAGQQGLKKNASSSSSTLSKPFAIASSKSGNENKESRRLTRQSASNVSSSASTSRRQQVDEELEVDGASVAEEEEEEENGDDLAEVEQKEIPVDPIDMNDLGRPRYCAEYVGEIYTHHLEAEAKFMADPTYMSRQTDLSERMRSMLINWLIEVHHKFKLMPQTMYLTVNLLDRFLERKMVTRKRLQLVGCTAMLLASKYEEIWAPEASDFVYVSDKAFTRNDILSMECVMLAALQFNLTSPSAYVFLQRFLKICDADPKCKLLATYLVEFTLQDYKMIKFRPSCIAATCIRLARRSLGEKSWTPTLEQHSQVTNNELNECEHGVFASIKTATRQDLIAVKKKYSDIAFDEVAAIPLREQGA